MRKSSGRHQRRDAAVLRYVCDDGRGIRRQKRSGGFRYIDSHGNVIRKATVLARIRALAIPPAWTDVWICPDPHGHLQATGRDARGRKQYRYHGEWRRKRDETKFGRMEAFAAALPVIRARTAADLRKPGLPRDKVLAAVVQLLEKSLIRVGNEEYARANGSFGLTTIQDNHVKFGRSSLRFEFRGKGGKKHSVAVTDPRLVRIVRQCRDLPGQELFQYLDDDGVRRDVNSADVNRYLEEITGTNFTAKDFRTWGATVLATTALRECEPTKTASSAKQHMLIAIDAVADALGNTRAICRKSYIHPAVLDAFMNGRTPNGRRIGAARKTRQKGTLRIEEAAVLEVLKKSA